jgi:hypothetical protein
VRIEVMGKTAQRKTCWVDKEEGGKRDFTWKGVVARSLLRRLGRPLGMGQRCMCC